jgi:hypothetical protein
MAVSTENYQDAEQANPSSQNVPSVWLKSVNQPAPHQREDDEHSAVGGIDPAEIRIAVMIGIWLAFGIWALLFAQGHPDDASDGLETATADSLSHLLRREGWLRFSSDERWVVARALTDFAGNDMWSIDIVVGDEDETYIDDDIALKPYPSLSAT